MIECTLHVRCLQIVRLDETTVGHELNASEPPTVVPWTFDSEPHAGDRIDGPVVVGYERLRIIGRRWKGRELIVEVEAYQARPERAA